ncbi:hypothetical protein [Acinetobacter bouvetii]|uniref:Uncharacterized protein n=1 Tax=Acinetobacter bouvetii TaxID=202951 RepID=A0A811GHY1_9GAMM|nr:hypothetical protein [Acinetobacter bouvetii]CAB1222409.1 hypothetical protein SFB21_3103 [Acinetobacter bouvetii]
MKTNSTKLLIQLLKAVIENEGINLDTLNIKINIENSEPVEAEFTKILAASDLELEQLQTESITTGSLSRRTFNERQTVVYNAIVLAAQKEMTKVQEKNHAY